MKIYSYGFPKSFVALHFIFISMIYFIFYFFNFLKYIYWLCYYSCPIPPPIHSILPTPPSYISPPYSSCPWVILISSLASTFPTLFLPSPSIFHLSLMLLILYTFPPLSPSQSLNDNPHVLVVCLVCSRFCFRCGR